MSPSSIGCGVVTSTAAARALQTVGDPVNCASSTPTVIQYVTTCSDTSAGSCAAAILSTLNAQVYAPGSTSLQYSLNNFTCISGTGPWSQASAITDQAPTSVVSYVTASITPTSSVAPSTSVSASVSVTVTPSTSVPASVTVTGSVTPSPVSESASASASVAETGSVTPSVSVSASASASASVSASVSLTSGYNPNPNRRRQ